MPAYESEIHEAIAEGVEIIELAPVRFIRGKKDRGKDRMHKNELVSSTAPKEKIHP